MMKGSCWKGELAIAGELQGAGRHACQASVEYSVECTFSEHLARQSKISSRRFDAGASSGTCSANQRGGNPEKQRGRRKMIGGEGFETVALALDHEGCFNMRGGELSLYDVRHCVRRLEMGSL